MQLARYQVSTQRPPPILGLTFSHDGRIFAVATETGYEVWRTWPMGLLRRRALPGTLARAIPLPDSALLVLQGGGANPLFPPNKAVLYHDTKGAVAELEFGDRIRGIAVRHRTIVIVLLRRAFAYEYDDGIRKIGDWETTENEHGLSALSTAPDSSLLALPGRQPGHVQLIHLPSAGSDALPTFRSPILLAHTHPLSSLACSASGAHILTASERGTLLRVWDTARGALEAELRRGVDRAEIWGLLFEDARFPPADRRDGLRRKGGRVVGWSDKGTVHVWEPARPPRQPPALIKALALPNYFSSTASYAQYYLPRKNPHAFSSAIGAAADAAGLPSMKMNEDADPEEREWAERFVVSWIEVEVEDDAPPRRAEPATVAIGPKKDSRKASISMGTREERRSYGSDSTRTATPSLRSQTPTMVNPSPYANLHRRRSSGASSVRAAAAAAAAGALQPSSGAGGRRQAQAQVAGAPTLTKRRERQLVVVTYAGDWYRLRLPQVDAEGGDGERDRGDHGDRERGGSKKTQCELVEYRRLGVGGGGW